MLIGIALILLAIVLLRHLFKRGIPTMQAAPNMPLRQYYNETDLPYEDYVVIDTETTGLDAKTCEVIEIGAIRYRNHQRVAQYHTYVRPDGRLNPDAARVNHITWDDVKDGKSIIDAVSDLMSFVGEDTIIGYNISFDIKFLQTRSQSAFKNPAFDVLGFARKMLPGRKSYKLSDFKKELGIKSASHNALDDCSTTAILYQHILTTPQGKAYVDARLSEIESERLSNQAYACENADDLDGAIAIYNQMIDAGYMDVHPYWRMAVIFRKQKRYAEEIEISTKALEKIKGLEFARHSVADFEHRIDAAQKKLEKQK